MAPLARTVRALVATLACAACAAPAGPSPGAPEPAGPARPVEPAKSAEPVAPVESVPAPDALPVGPRSTYSVARKFWVRQVPTPDPIPLNASFELELEIRDGTDPERPVTGAQVFVSGWMPDHLHGMNRRASTTELGDGRYRIRGMLFHMPGHWQILVDVVERGLSERAELDVHL